MDWLSIVFFAISLLAIIFGLLLSGQGAGSGIAALSGQETELFKKTKDRGFFKKLQRVMLGLAVLFIVVGIMLVTKLDKWMILGVAIAIFVVLLTATVLGYTTDRKAHFGKALLGFVFGAFVGMVVYMLAIDSNQKNAVNAYGK